MKARDIMTSPVYTIRDRDTVRAAARLMADEGVSALPVMDDEGRLVGILSHTDFFLHPIRYPGAGGHVFDILGRYVSLETIEEVSRSIGGRLVREVMKTPVDTIDHEADVAEVARRMLGSSRNRLPVMENGKLAGMVSRHDFVKLISGLGR